MKCYCASFNVGAVEVWWTALYLDKESVFLEIEESKVDIIEYFIDNFRVDIDEEKINKIMEQAFLDLKKNGTFWYKEHDFDFFILEQPIWKNYKQKINTENGTK